MAEKQEKKSYPRLPAKNWWTLRERFNKAVPGRVTADYLQSVLGLTSTASAANLLGPLRVLGLLDDEGKLTDRAMDWRHDDTYAQVCADILEDVYPDALRAAFPNPQADPPGVTQWFARNTGTGQGAAGGMASLYTLLAVGDPAKKTETDAATPRKAPSRGATSVPKPATSAGKAKEVVSTPKLVDRPSIHVNVQVHIAADAGVEQIDQIFKSMAEHLYGT